MTNNKHNHADNLNRCLGEDAAGVERCYYEPKPTKEQFADALASFLAVAQEKVNERFKDSTHAKPPRIEIEEGPKYVRVIAADVQGTSRSAFCFVGKEDGLIYKADGWKGPEKKNPRGSIYVDDGRNAITGYGAVYLR